MNIKKIFSLFLIAILGFVGVCKVDAVTISADGEYTLILNTKEGEIDGLPSKLIRFNFDEGEETVKLSDLTKGITPFNGRTMFDGWTDFSGDTKVQEELTKADFKYSGTSGSESYEKGLTIWAHFSDETLKGTGTYYVTIDPFAGTINGKDIIRITSKDSEFQTIDLSKYVPVREGYTFMGWDYNGKFVTSIDSSYFKDGDVVDVTAVYTKNTFEEDDKYILVLNANGGKIDGKASNKYNYVGGNNSGTSMAIFQYVPVREGYTFVGWNTKKDGSGKNYKYVYWRFWYNGGNDEFDRDTLNDDVYQNLTLYAKWESNGDTVKEIESSSNVSGNIEFAEAVSKDYVLDIKEVEVSKDLSNKNVKYIFDINILENGQVVKISDTTMRIKIALPDDLKGYNKYEVVYIKDGNIEKRIPAIVEDGYIIFETDHLSEYGIVATNEVVANPKTLDNVSVYGIMGVISIITLSGAIYIYKRKYSN